MQQHSVYRSSPMKKQGLVLQMEEKHPNCESKIYSKHFYNVLPLWCKSLLLLLLSIAVTLHFNISVWEVFFFPSICENKLTLDLVWHQRNHRPDSLQQSHKTPKLLDATSTCQVFSELHPTSRLQKIRKSKSWNHSRSRSHGVTAEQSMLLSITGSAKQCENVTLPLRWVCMWEAGRKWVCSYPGRCQAISVSCSDGPVTAPSLIPSPLPCYRLWRAAPCCDVTICDAFTCQHTHTLNQSKISFAYVHSQQKKIQKSISFSAF